MTPRFRILAAGCCLALCSCSDDSAPPPQTAAVPPPPSLALTLEPGEIQPGQTAQLQWIATGAGQCTATGAWSGARPAAGSESVSPAAPGSYDYQLDCTGAGGSVHRAVALTVRAPPVALVFNATPVELPLGASAVLTWSAANALECAASGAWSGVRAAAGTETVTPAVAGSHAYSLLCSGTGTPAAAIVTLDVRAPATDSHAEARAEFDRLRALEQELSP